MKYSRFIKNLFTFKKKNNRELNSNNESIRYEFIYSNNYIDTVFNILDYYKLLKNKDLTGYDIYNCVEYGDSDTVEKIISEVLDIDNSLEALSTACNIIVKVYIDSNDNWKRLAKVLMDSDATIIMNNDNDCFYASLSINSINALTKINSIDREIVSFISNLVTDFYDTLFRSEGAYDEYFESILGLGYNVSFTNHSVISIDTSLDDYVIMGVDIIKQCPSLAKVYIVSNSDSSISGSASVPISDVLRFHSISINKLMTNRDELSERLLNKIIEKYSLYDITITNKEQPSITYEEIDEVI